MCGMRAASCMCRWRIRGAGRSMSHRVWRRRYIRAMLGLSRALSAFDMTHNFSATYRYQLPLGRWCTGIRGWSEGWQVSGLTRFGTGLPVTLVNNNDTSLLGTAPNGINNNGIDEPEFTPGNLVITAQAGRERVQYGAVRTAGAGDSGQCAAAILLRAGRGLNRPRAGKEDDSWAKGRRWRFARRRSTCSTMGSSSVRTR